MKCTLTLPYPVSVNAMYANNKNGGKGRYKTKQYKEWIKAANEAFLTQDISFFDGEVTIAMRVGKGRANADCTNLIKGVEDFLVYRGIIVDDCKKYVRGVSICWDDELPRCVEVEITTVGER